MILITNLIERRNRKQKTRDQLTLRLREIQLDHWWVWNPTVKWRYVIHMRLTDGVGRWEWTEKDKVRMPPHFHPDETKEDPT